MDKQSKQCEEVNTVRSKRNIKVEKTSQSVFAVKSLGPSEASLQTENQVLELSCVMPSSLSDGHVSDDFESGRVVLKKMKISRVKLKDVTCVR